MHSLTKTLFTGCLAVLTLTAAGFGASKSTGSVAALDQAAGLPEARLGTPLEAFPGLQLVEDVGRWVTYKPPGDKWQYAGFNVIDMKYNFFKGKLYSIDLEVRGRKSTLGILKTLERTFGTDYTLDIKEYAKTAATLETREWTGAKTYLLYKSASDGAGATLIFLDRPTWDELQVPKRERAAATRAMLNPSFVNGDF